VRAIEVGQKSCQGVDILRTRRPRATDSGVRR